MQDDFFNVVSVQEFLNFRKQFNPICSEELIGIDESVFRILSQDLFSPEELPPFARSCMDGYAVNSQDLFGASDSNPVYLECIDDIAVNSLPAFPIRSGQCSQLATGSILPSGADSVVMIEYCDNAGANEIEVRRPVTPGENVMQKGEDCSFNELILSAGSKVRPQETGLLSALGFSQVPVLKKPRIGLLTTGDELVDIRQTPQPGYVRDVNSHTIASWIRTINSESKHYGIVSDDRSELNNTLENAVDECDLVLVTGGSSVGARDITLQSFSDLGNLLQNGVSLSPGKPTLLANIKGKPVLGLPGQVTSTLIVMFVLVLPYIRYISGESDFDSSVYYNTKSAVLSRNVSSKPGREDYIRVYLQKDESGYLLAVPVLGKSGLLNTMLDADGLIKVESNLEGLKKGSSVEVYIL